MICLLPPHGPPWLGADAPHVPTPVFRRPCLAACIDVRPSVNDRLGSLRQPVRDRPARVHHHSGRDV